MELVIILLLFKVAPFQGLLALVPYQFVPCSIKKSKRSFRKAESNMMMLQRFCNHMHTNVITLMKVFIKEGSHWH